MSRRFSFIHGELEGTKVREYLKDYNLVLCSHCHSRGYIQDTFEKHTCTICQGSGTLPIKKVQ